MVWPAGISGMAPTPMYVKGTILKSLSKLLLIHRTQLHVTSAAAAASYSYYIIVTQHEKIGLMCTKYTTSNHST